MPEMFPDKSVFHEHPWCGQFATAGRTTKMATETIEEANNEGFKVNRVGIATVSHEHN